MAVLVALWLTAPSGLWLVAHHSGSAPRRPHSPSCAEAGKAWADDCNGRKIHLPALSHIHYVIEDLVHVLMNTHKHTYHFLFHLNDTSSQCNVDGIKAMQNFANDSSSPRRHQLIIQCISPWFHHYEGDKRALLNFNVGHCRGEFYW